MQGTVKWFSCQRGYGFITTEEGAEVFVHHSGIKGQGYKLLEEGQRVEFDTEQGEKGIRAINVVNLDGLLAEANSSDDGLERRG